MVLTLDLGSLLVLVEEELWSEGVVSARERGLELYWQGGTLGFPLFVLPLQTFQVPHPLTLSSCVSVFSHQ